MGFHRGQRLTPSKEKMRPMSAVIRALAKSRYGKPLVRDNFKIPDTDPDQQTSSKEKEEDKSS